MGELTFGRVIFGGFFVYNGLNHFKQRQALTQYAGAKDVPQPDLAVLASGAGSRLRPSCRSRIDPSTNPSTALLTMASTPGRSVS